MHCFLLYAGTGQLYVFRLENQPVSLLGGGTKQDESPNREKCLMRVCLCTYCMHTPEYASEMVRVTRISIGD